jgi:hypothetical protein
MEVRFKDVSWPIKTIVVFGWIMLPLCVTSFMVGYVGASL